MQDRMTKEQLLAELEEMRQQLHLLESCRAEMHLIGTKYERLLESAPDAMLFVTPDARIVTVNAQMEKLFGYAEKELVGKDLHMLIPKKYRDAHRDNVARYLFSVPG